MTADKQMQILNLYRGKPLKRAYLALEIMTAYTEQKQAELRIKLCGLQLGD